MFFWDFYDMQKYKNWMCSFVWFILESFPPQFHINTPHALRSLNALGVYGVLLELDLEDDYSNRTAETPFVYLLAQECL